MEKLQTKVILTKPIHEAGLQILTENIETVILTESDKPEVVLPFLDDQVEGVLLRHSIFNRAMIEKARNLKVIARHGVGVDLVDMAAATEHGVLVINSPNAATSSVAEHVVTLVMALCKKTFIAHQALCAGNFGIRNTYEPDDIEGKTIGIIGFGRIGRAVAQRCIGLGMKAIAYTPHQDLSAAQNLGVRLCDSLEEVLQQADFVSLSTPLTPETRHMLSTEQFAMMKPTAYLINCARGEVVDEAALIAALKTGQIAGAGIDVFEQEPPGTDNELFRMENVIVTPHSAAMTRNSNRKMACIAAQQLVDALRGNYPPHIVNKEVLKTMKTV